MIGEGNNNAATTTSSSLRAFGCEKKKKEGRGEGRTIVVAVARYGQR